jgi:hypothetical protein
MVSSAQILDVMRESTSAEPPENVAPRSVNLSSRAADARTETNSNSGFLLAPIPAVDYTLEISNTGYNPPVTSLDFPINARALYIEDEVAVHESPSRAGTRIGSTAFIISSTKAKSTDSLPTQRSIWTADPDLTVTAGLAVTPDRKATEDGTWNQESKNGPAVGVEYQAWKNLFTELDYVNTNTRLQNYAINTWTMNRLSLDAGYEHRWHTGKLAPFVKVGTGVMILLSGHATNYSNVGLDDRMEVLTGAGVRYRLSNHMSAILEYEGRIIRNPDFSDHSWKPERNFLTEGKAGLSYTFGGREK